MATTRYFFTLNAVRPIQLEGRVYKFVPLSITGGRISGVFDTTDDTDIAILSRAAGQRVGISEMSEADALLAKKKLQASPQASTDLSPTESKPPRVVAPAGPLLSMGESAGTAESAKSNPSTENTIPLVTSLVHVGKVNPPRPLISDRDRILRSRLGK